jgi:hypothetical protein
MANKKSSIASIGISTGPMIRELRRWSMPARGGSRWSEWADSLINRRGRVAAGQGVLNLILSRPLSVIHLMRERLMLASRRFYPLVNLAIHAILRNTVAGGKRYFPPSPRAAVDRKLEERIRESLSPAVLEREAIQVRRETIRKQALLSHNPLRLVFQRLYETDRIVQAGNLERVIEQSAEMILHRVSRHSQRIEQAPALTSVLVAKQAPTAISREASVSVGGDVSRSAFEPRSADPSIVTSTHAAAWPRDARAAGVNLDQITDQVMQKLDRRINAWRERTGKV